MNKFFIGILCLFFAVPILAQNLTIEVLEKETMLPLTGASVQIDKQNIDHLTNHNGMVKLDSIAAGEYPVTISFTGYETITDTLKVTTAMPVKTYYMQEGSLALSKVVVTATRSTRTIKRIPTRIEFIGSEELGEKAMMNAANISMVLRESTGIQIQQTSLSSANSSIKIQGLDGRYTQILKDGFPLFGGFSGGVKH